MKYLKLILIITIAFALSSCGPKRPKMSYDQDDKGAVQDIEAFNVVSTAENFRETSTQFAEDAIDILSRNNNLGDKKPLTRRVSLTDKSLENKKSLEIVDRNLEIKKLENTEVTLKFNNMEIRSALKLFAGLVQRNIIIGKEVQGEITIDFENIKWGSAVYAILDINSLIMTVDKDSGLLRVHTKEVFAELEKSKIERTLQVNKNLETLENGGGANSDTDGNIVENTYTEIFKIFYAKSGDLIDPLTNGFGENTDILVNDDELNNQLMITGTMVQLNKAEKILNLIDIEKKQVMIEAYIINASDNFTNTFNANLTAIDSQAVVAGRDRITFVGVDTNPSVTETFTSTEIGVASEGLANTGFPTDNAAITSGAFILGNLGMTKLKAVINASINDENTETISNPKLFAMDGEEANLTQGDTLLKIIPASGDAAGSTTTVSQSLNMTVTPEVIGSRKVKLTLDVANNKPGATSSGGDTTTKEESITSVVQLETGQVAILGGVYTNTREDQNNYNPIFSKIPIIGSFFKQKTKDDKKTQLLIFLSANIV